jgi:hypothetical protein
MRPVRWLALRAPALYRDEDWDLPKWQLNKKELAAYRQTRVTPEHNRALAACDAFKGDALVVECEHDKIVPHPVIENYVAAFTRPRSLTARVVADADHGFSAKAMQKEYTGLLIKWLTEMIGGARSSEAARKVAEHKQGMAAQGDTSG